MTITVNNRPHVVLKPVRHSKTPAHICPRRSCRLPLVFKLCEHSEIQECACGYRAVTVTGETKLRYAEAQRMDLEIRRV